MATNPAELTNARLSTRGGLPYKLVKQSLSSEVNSSTFTEVYIMRVSDLVDFIVESFPPPGLLNGIIVPSFPRYCPGNPYLLTKSFTAEPVDQNLPTDMWGYDSGAPAGTYGNLMQVTIQYQTGNAEQDYKPNDPETFLKHSVTAGGEFLVIPPKNTAFVEEDDEGNEGEEKPNKDFQVPCTKVLPTIEHTLDWTYVTNPPWDAIRQILGCVNQDVMSIFNSAPEETVMFMSLTGEQQYTTAGVRPWSLSYKFSERNITEGSRHYGWNHVYNPSKPGFERIKKRDPNTGVLSALYESADFLDLFRSA